MKNNSLVSVIITTRNEADVIGTLLRSIKKQTYKPIEVIVVDNRSSDKTVSIAQKYTKHVFIKGPERSSQRNYGAMKAKGEYLLFLDADMELTPKVIEECVSKLKTQNVPVRNATQSVAGGKRKTNQEIGGVIIPEISVGEKFWERVKAFERSFYFDDASYLTDAARFFSKKAFLKVGKYDETITGTEDWDLSESIRKNGFTITWITKYLYHHERIPSLWKHARKFYYYGIDASRTLKKQQQRLLSPKTIHFLRPAFYKKWTRLVSHPVLSSAMSVMLFSQMFFGGLGFIMGKFKKINT